MASNSENGFCDSSRSQNANIGVTGPRSKAHQLRLPSEGSRGELVPGLSQFLVVLGVFLLLCISPMCVSSSLLSASNPALPLSYKILHLGSLLIIQDNLPNSKFSTESHLLYIDLFFPFIRQHKFQRPGTDIFVGGGGGGIIQLTPPSNNSPPQPILGTFYKYQGTILLLLLYKWRRKWQPTPVFLPGKLHGQRSLMGYGP